jgi:alpha/beta superfamily hydrolase
VLRFNFRGVGRSGGEHAHLEGEIEDARAALDWQGERYPGLPYGLAGFSFGSRVITRLGCASEGASFLIAAGFPTRWGPPDYLEKCTAPKIFIQSTQDQYGPRAELEAMYERFAAPKELHWVEAADHFFAGALDELEETVKSSAERR